MKKVISILTTTRAEYGLLREVIFKLSKIADIDARVVVSGTHVSIDHGYTINEIVKDNVQIDKQIEILCEGNHQNTTSEIMGIAQIKFSEYFNELKPDALLVLGDRFETLAVVLSALVLQIPIFHIHGGETTQGAIDEAIRHSITKCSVLHFTSTEEYRRRVIQLGEQPHFVFNVGSLGVENVLNLELLSREELAKNLNFELDDKYAVMTYHPVTLEQQNIEQQVDNLLTVIKMNQDIMFLVTKANADQNGNYINSRLEEAKNVISNMKLYDSLGVIKYLSAVKYAQFVIGNSSSGIIEVPSFGIPTINIGNRQKGRIQAKSIINCESTVEDINNSINTALNHVKNSIDNPYYKAGTSDSIVSIIHEFIMQPINLQKEFFDLEVVL